MLDIVICEDNHEYRSLLETTVTSIIENKSLDARIVLSTESPRVVSDFIDSEKPSVFFLDIDLNASQTGYDLAGTIRDKIPNPYIVFISRHTDYVFRSFKVRAFDFLPKPVTRKAIDAVISNIFEDYSRNIDEDSIEYFNIKSGPKIYRIVKKDIILIEKRRNQCVFSTKTDTIFSYDTLDTISEKLDSDDFARCHKSFIVNRRFIREINSSTMEITLTNGEKCPIGGKYRSNII